MIVDPQDAVPIYLIEISKKDEQKTKTKTKTKTNGPSEVL